MQTGVQKANTKTNTNVNMWMQSECCNNSDEILSQVSLSIRSRLDCSLTSLEKFRELPMGISIAIRQIKYWISDKIPKYWISKLISIGVLCNCSELGRVWVCKWAMNSQELLGLDCPLSPLLLSFSLSLSLSHSFSSPRLANWPTFRSLFETFSCCLHNLQFIILRYLLYVPQFMHKMPNKTLH